MRKTGVFPAITPKQPPQLGKGHPDCLCPESLSTVLLWVRTQGVPPFSPTPHPMHISRGAGPLLGIESADVTQPAVGFRKKTAVVPRWRTMSTGHRIPGEKAQGGPIWGRRHVCRGGEVGGFPGQGATHQSSTKRACGLFREQSGPQCLELAE